MAKNVPFRGSSVKMSSRRVFPEIRKSTDCCPISHQTRVAKMRRDWQSRVSPVTALFLLQQFIAAQIA